MKDKIAKIQAEMQPLKKDTQAFKYKYATLKQIQDALSPILEKYKVLWTTPIKQINGRDVVFSVLEDLESDNKIEAGLTMPDGLSPQDAGSAVTYFRRYTILGLLNLETEDDDGKKANDAVVAFRKFNK